MELGREGDGILRDYKKGQYDDKVSFLILKEEQSNDVKVSLFRDLRTTNTNAGKSLSRRGTQLRSNPRKIRDCHALRARNDDEKVKVLNAFA